MDDEKMTYERWKEHVAGLLPWPDASDVLEAVDLCELDAHSEERIIALKQLVAAHYVASSSGVFNDE